MFRKSHHLRDHMEETPVLIVVAMDREKDNLPQAVRLRLSRLSQGAQHLPSQGLLAG